MIETQFLQHSTSYPKLRLYSSMLLSKYFILILFFHSNTIFSQNFDSNDIIGLWLPQDNSVLIHIYENEGKYFAKNTDSKGGLIKLKDQNNPNPDLTKNHFLMYL